MSLIIKKIKFKNIMSVGNIETEIKLSNNLLTLIVGRNKDIGIEGAGNGVGKSTIIQALMYGLYGEPLTDDIKKDKLVNFTNKKGLEITVWFEKDGIDYRIERGRKPLYNKFFINDQEYEEDETLGTSKTTQDYITETLGISYDLAKTIIILDTFNRPFLSLKEKEQKPIIEELLSITLLSKKAENISKQLKNVKSDIKIEEGKIAGFIQNNERIEKNIENLSFKESVWNIDIENMISNQQKHVDTLSEIDIDVELANHDTVKNINTLEQEIVKLLSLMETLKESLEQNDKDLDKKKKSLLDVENHKCPACEQQIHSDIFSKLKTNLIEEIEEIELEKNNNLENLKFIEDEILLQSDALNDFGPPPKLNYTSIKDAYDHKNKLQKAIYELEEFKNRENPYTLQINSLQETSMIDINYDIINDLTSTKDHMDFLIKLLTSNESFIRKKIIEQNIALLNKNLTYYLEKMMLPHIITFNSDLSVNIVLEGNDYDFGLLSKGEKNRVMLSVAWAFRDTWESLNGTINLWFFDEVIDQGMDTQGITSALEVLDNFVNDRNKDVFLISHKTDLIANIENVLYAIKENNFTNYEHVE